MIEKFLNSVVSELGPIGVLIVGLYFFLFSPLQDISRSLGRINEEIAQILLILKAGVWQK